MHTGNTHTQINGLDIKHVRLDTRENGASEQKIKKRTRDMCEPEKTQERWREKTKIMKLTGEKNRAKYQVPYREAL